MSICINPHCSKQENSDNELFCHNCGSELLLKGRYKVIKPLGKGGFGATYEVSDSRHSKTKVLKVLINNQPKAVELFKREAEVLKILDHPGIPRVEQNGDFIYLVRNSQQPLHCLVMEKVEGMDLYSYLKRRGNNPIDEDSAVQWLKEIVIILQLVHEQNYFHRDIKPPNIMLRAIS
ncbi:MAG: protein kinase [Cyanobacteria bacterium P01_A01_bin.45]